MLRWARELVRRHAAAALLLSIVVAAIGWTWNSRVAGGADSYGYVSQADLWLRGDLFIDQSFAAAAPWPTPRFTFTPLGYRPEPDGYRIVPVCSPGLPMLMAAAKAIAGQCGLFAVVPIAGGVLVFATYWIGRRLGRPVVGLAASWIVSTSAAMLFMLVVPMSDVPAAAAWAVAVACVLGDSTPSIVAAGVASAAAILIRPNLAPVAAVIAVWLAWRDLVARRRLQRAAIFSIAASLGAIVVALVNRRLYGSPLASGYGDLSGKFALSYVMPNVRRYVTWLVSAETPFALVGLVCLAVPAARLWPTAASRRGLALVGGVAAVVWISYLVYLPWDAWWYLRFLLPAWPMMAIGTASLLAIAWRQPARRWQAAAIVTVMAIGVFGIAQAKRRGVFEAAAGEAKYVEVANVVEAITAPGDVIMTAQHSGSIRYYAGRLTVRWDSLDPAWLDRSIDWLSTRGHHAYFVVERQEMADFRDRFAGSSARGRLDWQPIVTFRRGNVQLFDAFDRDEPRAPVEQPELRGVHSCPTPRSSPGLQ